MARDRQNLRKRDALSLTRKIGVDVGGGGSWASYLSSSDPAPCPRCMALVPMLMTRTLLPDVSHKQYPQTTSLPLSLACELPLDATATTPQQHAACSRDLTANCSNTSREYGTLKLACSISITPSRSRDTISRTDNSARLGIWRRFVPVGDAAP